jgi:hypothetical protein
LSFTDFPAEFAPLRKTDKLSSGVMGVAPVHVAGDGPAMSQFNVDEVDGIVGADKVLTGRMAVIVGPGGSWPIAWPMFGPTPP